VARFDRLFPVFAVLLAVGMVALLANQVIAIEDHGFAGWLRGDGPYQTEWEVRAVIGLLLVWLPFVILIPLVRLGEAIAHRTRDLRWARATRRSRAGR
jgi:hypothetical protein